MGGQIHLLESDFYDALLQQGQIIPKNKNKSLFLGTQPVKKREKTLIEESIEKDDVEQLRVLSDSSNFDYNSEITKINEL